MDVFLNGFPRKLLIAISVVAILTMCLMPAEARVVGSTNEAHRRRHQRQATRPPLKLTKEITGTVRRSKNANALLYNKATDRVLRKLRNVKAFFLHDEAKLSESRLFGIGNPKWLPKVNFLNIREHNYTSTYRGVLLKELRFNYLIPKLYKSLKEYERVFKVLLRVSLKFDHDFSVDSKNSRWVEALTNTRGNVSLLISVITDSTNMVKLTLPSINEETSLLNIVAEADDPAQSLKNNYLAFRGYEALLKNWHAEFKCAQYRREKGTFVPKPPKTIRICREYVNKLNRRRAHSPSQRKRRSKQSALLHN